MPNRHIHLHRGITYNKPSEGITDSWAKRDAGGSGRGSTEEPNLRGKLNRKQRAENT